MFSTSASTSWSSTSTRVRVTLPVRTSTSSISWRRVDNKIEIAAADYRQRLSKRPSQMHKDFPFPFHCTCVSCLMPYVFLRLSYSSVLFQYRGTYNFTGSPVTERVDVLRFKILEPASGLFNIPSARESAAYSGEVASADMTIGHSAGSQRR